MDKPRDYDIFVDQNGRIWIIGPFEKDRPKIEFHVEYEDDSWPGGPIEFEPFDEIRRAYERMWEKQTDYARRSIPDKVTPASVELSTMKLRDYNPERLCPFCNAPGEQTVECVTFGSYYEHDKTGLWAYIPFPHTLKNCRVCGGSYPESLAPGLEIKDE